MRRLGYHRNGDIHDKTYRKFLIQIFVNRIYLYDDKFTITFNTGDEEVTISDILLGNIEDALMGKTLCLSNIVRHQRTQIRTLYIVRNVFAIIVKIPDGS